MLYLSARISVNCLRIVSLASLCILLWASTTSAQISYRIVPLGDANSSVEGFSISSSGTRATGSGYFGNTFYEPFLFNRALAAFISLALPANATYGYGHAINNSGVTLLRSSVGPFVLDFPNSNISPILNPLGTIPPEVHDINNQGTVAGSVITLQGSSTIRYGAIWENGVPNIIGQALGFEQSLKINNSGSIACVYVPSQSSAHYPCLVSNNIMTPLPTLTSDSSCYPYGINNSNEVIGVCPDQNGTARGVIWQNGSISTLPDSNGISPFAPRDVSDCGQIVGRARVIGNASQARAFLYWNNNLYNLNNLIPANTGWIIEEAVSISATNGRILINGKKDGHQRSAIMVPNSAGQCG